NFEAIARAVERGEIRNASIVAGVSDVPAAPGLDRARARGLPACAVYRALFSTRRAYEEEVLRILETARAELLCLAGYMRILSPEFISRYPGRILNIHHSLLPKYPGLSAHQRPRGAGAS